MKGQLFRVFGAALALVVCYRSIYVRPRAQPVVNAGSHGALLPEEAAAMQEQIRLLLAQHRLQEALPLAQRILQEFPENPIYLQRVATIQDQLGNYKEEVGLWERFMKVASDPGDSCPMLGEAYRKLGQLQADIDACARSVAMEPQNSEFLFYLGRAYEWDKQYAKAREIYQKVCALRPGNSDGTVGWARMEVFIGDPAKARGMVATILAQRPSNVDALLVHGMALRQMGRYQQATVPLAKGMALRPDSTDFMLALSAVLKSQRRIPEALDVCDRFLARNPGVPEAITARAALSRKGARS